MSLCRCILSWCLLLWLFEGDWSCSLILFSIELFGIPVCRVGTADSRRGNLLYAILDDLTNRLALPVGICWCFLSIFAILSCCLSRKGEWPSTRRASTLSCSIGFLPICFFQFLHNDGNSCSFVFIASRLSVMYCNSALETSYRRLFVLWWLLREIFSVYFFWAAMTVWGCLQAAICVGWISIRCMFEFTGILPLYQQVGIFITIIFSFLSWPISFSLRAIFCKVHIYVAESLFLFQAKNRKMQLSFFSFRWYWSFAKFFSYCNSYGF